MENWYCFKCKEKMVEKDISTSYLEISRFIRGIQCPQCKTVYMSEKTVLEEIRPGEEQIEEKL